MQPVQPRKSSKIKERCALCGLQIDGAPIDLDFDGDIKHFCCRGCGRVYEIARQQGMLDQVIAGPVVKQEPIKDRVFTPSETTYFSLHGMWCAGCAVSAEQILRRTPGVKSADVSFAAERGRLQYDPKLVNADVLLKRLGSLGYSAQNLVDPEQKVTERHQERTLVQLIIAFAFGMQVMVIYLVQLYPRYASGDFSSPTLRMMQYLVWALTTPILLFGSLSFFRGAWRALVARTATMDTLVALGILSAYCYSAYISIRGGGAVYFDTVGMITTFVMFGRYLEAVGGTQARKNIHQLLKLQPDQAWKWEQDEWRKVNALKLEPGDRIMIKPGERVPADAEILEGQAAINEAMLTGESMPLNKAQGEMIYAGTVVSDENLVARVTKRSSDTRLAQISKLVEETLSTKPPIQRLADRASTYFAFGIILVAIATFACWGLVTASLAKSTLTAVAVLVVACPCALGLATPLAMTITLGQTTRAGLLVRNSAVLETAVGLHRVVFDKTGTLTRGEMSVEATQASNAGEAQGYDILRLAAAVEQFSEHPIAKAILAKCMSVEGCGPLSASEFKSSRGYGASARVDGTGEQRVLVGSERFLEVSDGWKPRTQDYSKRGDTIVWVGTEKGVGGFIALRDQPNESAIEAIHQLRQRGIKTAMLSGDNPATSGAIAAELGIEDYAGNCPPQQKAEQIKAWQEAGQLVCMVGDGVNDAPALAQADVSIAVAGGTEIAGEASDVLLMNTDLTLIAWFIDRSKRTRAIIIQNLGWAFAYNLVAIPLAVAGVISPAVAAGAMAVSSVLVVVNSLRLRR